jgi:hypothetical protein
MTLKLLTTLSFCCAFSFANGQFNDSSLRRTLPYPAILPTNTAGKRIVFGYNMPLAIQNVIINDSTVAKWLVDSLRSDDIAWARIYKREQAIKTYGLSPDVGLFVLKLKKNILVDLQNRKITRPKD